MKLKTFMLALLSVSVISLTACGDDNEPETDGNQTTTTKNPMVGKTIRCQEVVMVGAGDVRRTNNFAITFNDETNYTWDLYQREEEYWLGTWNETYLLDTTDYGTYIYSDTEIKLFDENGYNYGTLTKISNGWQMGADIYK